MLATKRGTVGYSKNRVKICFLKSLIYALKDLYSMAVNSKHSREFKTSTLDYQLRLQFDKNFS